MSTKSKKVQEDFPSNGHKDDDLIEHSHTNEDEFEKEAETDNTLASMRRRIQKMEEEANKISKLNAEYNEEQQIFDSLHPDENSKKTGSNSGTPILSASIKRMHKTETETSPNSDPIDESNPESFPKTVEEQKEIDSRSIFVSGLDPGTEAAELKQHFEVCGTIERITIVCDKWSAKPKGCAYIQFKSKESCASAQLYNGKELNGKPIKVSEKRTNMPKWMRGRGRGRGRYRGRGRGRGRGYHGYGPYSGGYYPRGGYRGGFRGYWAPY